MSKINELKTRLSGILDNDEIGDLVLNFFSKEFSAQDYAHLFRQERWKMGLYCPNCHSNNIKKHGTIDSYLFQYLCLDCNTIFTDDSGSPLTGSSIPLSVWLQVWYLNQYCTSLQYIADKLNLDLNIIINMLQSMKTLFQQDPAILKKEPNLKDSNHNNFSGFRQEEKLKKFLILGGDSGKQPTDTAEYRRQKTIKKNNNPTKKPRV